MDNLYVDNIEDKLSKYFCDIHNIDINKKYKLEYVQAIDLLTSERLDLVSKIKWLDAMENNRGKEFYQFLYREQVKAITGRTEIERGKEDTKNSLEEFEKVFNELKKIKYTEIDPNISVIPVANNNVIMDGAHRTAIGIFYNKKIPIVRIDSNFPDTGANFFLDNLMNKELVEYMVNEYCKLTNKNVYAICMWPKSYDKKLREEAENLISNFSKIIYKKEIDFNFNALRNFIIQIYRDYDWLGGFDNNFTGASEKAKQCWMDNQTSIFYFIEGPNLDSILDLKKQIRELYNIGNDSVHITDNNSETIQIANLILNDNSIDFLRNGIPDKYKKINVLIEEFKKYINEDNLNTDDFVVDSSGIMALYGLREANDLDYLSNYTLSCKNNEMDRYTNYLKFHNESMDELIYNPKNYFYYNNVKFITINRIREFKNNKATEKDKIDVKLIDSMKTGKFSLSFRLSKLKYDFKRYFIFYYRKLKMFLKNFKLTAPIFKLLKKIIKG